MVDFSGFRIKNYYQQAATSLHKIPVKERKKEGKKERKKEEERINVNAHPGRSWKTTFG